MHVPSKDFLLRIFGTGLKFLSLLVILKFDKFVVPVFYFYSTFAAFLFKFSILSELNNYRRFTNETKFFNISRVFFFNSLVRIIFFIFLIYLFLSINEYKSYFPSIAFFILGTFVINYVGACFVINSNQLKASIIYFFASVTLFISIIIAFLIEDNFLNNICTIYFFLNTILLAIKFKKKQNIFYLKKISFVRLKSYLIKKNFSLRVLHQLKRAFFSISSYILLTLVAYLISTHEHTDIDTKNMIIISLYVSNVVLLYFTTTFIFPNVLKITKGKFKFIKLSRFLIILLLTTIIYSIIISFLSDNFEIITIFYSLILFTYLSYLISFQDFYIQARFIKLSYIIYFLIAFVLNVYLMNLFYLDFIFLPLLLILPRLSIFLINKLYFKNI